MKKVRIPYVINAKSIPRLLRVSDARGLRTLFDKTDIKKFTSVVRESLKSSELLHLLKLLDKERASELLEELPSYETASLLLKLSTSDAADILEEIEPDVGTDIIQALPNTQARKILVKTERPYRKQIEVLLHYPPDTAGGAMTTRFVSLDSELTVEQALLAIRRLSQEVEAIYYLYIVDRNDKLIGVISLRELILASKGKQLKHIMKKNFVKIKVDEDKETSARLVLENNLSAIPVVDSKNRILGVITFDDAQDIIEVETTEDIHKIAGSKPLVQPYLETPIISLFKKRIGWLLLLFVAEMYTGTVLRTFKYELASVITLSFFIPLLIGTGGNIASQTSTTIVRAIALNEISLRQTLRVIVRESIVSILIGAVIGGIGFIRALAWGTGYPIAFVVGATLSILSLFAASVGAMIPQIVHRLGFDPAIVSAPFMTTLVDGTGLIIYFIIARTILGI